MDFFEEYNEEYKLTFPIWNSYEMDLNSLLL